MESLIQQWKKDEQAPFEGWDFSYIQGRYTEEKPPWSYRDLAADLVKQSQSVLDVATGGGEIFASLAPFPGRATAIEGYQPNIEVAKQRLAPLGVHVLGVDEMSAWPFEDGEFDLVLNRHGGVNVLDSCRVLQQGGAFLTQQVDGNSHRDLKREFGAHPKWPENTLSILGDKLTQAGLIIQRSTQWSGTTTFLDVGALVYFLKAIPWTVEGFSVDAHLDQLAHLQKRLEMDGKLEFTAARFLIQAVKR